MKKKILAALLAMLGFLASSAIADMVSFKSMSKTQGGELITLQGDLTRPNGAGPFPAVVMLHGCSGIEGIKQYLDIWAQRLASWGYVSLMVDSFGPRGESNICEDTRVFLIPPNVRAQDAHDAKSYLAALPFVNRNQIALMGWSHGGWTVLFTIDKTLRIQNRGDPFRAAIAFYPYCSVPLRGFDSPLLILTGELDDWCPPAMCELRMPSGTTAPEVTLKIYPEATHGFDFEGIDTTRAGHRLLYNPAASNDAVEQVKNFLTKYVGEKK